ncbi:MAG: heme-binding protein [Pseudomonadota bacterium]|nr:heme-binding protein [Pseudomonadota bacterium]
MTKTRTSISESGRCLAVAAILGLAGGPVAAGDLISVKRMTLDLASDVAKASVEACRKKGYQISVVVVDRGATPMVVMRDVFASRFTTEISERKANAVILSGTSTKEFARNRADILREMNEVSGILVLDGALPIQASGSLIGAVGVSGAPGGEIDAECAKAGIEAVEERLEFAD